MPNNVIIYKLIINTDIIIYIHTYICINYDLKFQAINALELAMDALKPIQLKFYEDFPADPREGDYGFETPSTMKPTQWSCKF